MRSYRQNLAVSAVLWTAVVQVQGFVPLGVGFHNQKNNNRLHPYSASGELRRRREFCYSSPLTFQRRRRRRRNSSSSSSRLHVSMHSSSSRKNNNNNNNNNSNKTTPIDFYAILEVSPHSSADEIKRAYRKQAKKYHPDSNAGMDTTEQFQNVNRAYEVLSNPVLKSKYDMFGANGIGTSAASDEIKANRVYSGSSSTSSSNSRRNTSSRSNSNKSGGNGGGMPADGYGFGGIHSNPADIPGGYYKTAGTGGATSSFGRTVNPADVMDRTGRAKYGPGGGIVGDDLQLTMEIEFETAIFGGRETIWIDHLETCDCCAGSGVKAGSRTNYCMTCGGAGFTVEVAKTAFGSLQSQTTCPSCKGSGRNIDEFCDYCYGQGVEEVSKQIDVTIPAGVEGYTRLRIRGEGNAGPKGGPPGDLFIFLQVLPHPVFRRDGASIHANQTVDYIDAILGNTVVTEVVGGKKALLKIPDGTQHEEVIRLEGCGARSLIGEPGARGDHVVTVHVGIPEEITVEEMDILLQLRALQNKKVTQQEEEDLDWETEERAPRSTWRQLTTPRTIDRSTIDDASTIRVEDYEVSYVAEGGAAETASAAMEKHMEELIDINAQLEIIEELLQAHVNETRFVEEQLDPAIFEDSVLFAEAASPIPATDSSFSFSSGKSPYFANAATNTTEEFDKLRELLHGPIKASTAPAKKPRPTSKKPPAKNVNTANELDKLRELLRVPVETSSSPSAEAASKKKTTTQADMLDTARELDKLRELLHAPVAVSKKKTEAAAAAKAREIEAIKELEKLRQLLHEPLQEIPSKPTTSKKSRTQAEINAANELKMLRELIQPKEHTNSSGDEKEAINLGETPSQGVGETKGASYATTSDDKAAPYGEAKATSFAAATDEADAQLKSLTTKAESFAADIKKKVAGSAMVSGKVAAPVKNSAPGEDDQQSDLNSKVIEEVKAVKSLSSLGRFDAESESSEDIEAPDATLLSRVVEASLVHSKGSSIISKDDIVVEDAYSLSETIGPGGSTTKENDERSFAWDEITADSWRKNRPSDSSGDDHKFEEMLFSIFKL